MAERAESRLSDTYQVPRASRYAAPEFEDQSLPLIYGDLTIPQTKEAGVYHPPKIDPAGGGVYCLAGHEIAGGIMLFDEEGRIGADRYDLALSQNYQGAGVVALALFGEPPKGALSAACRGKTDVAGGLIENPVNIVRDLMTEVWGFSEQDIDTGALSRAAAAADAQGYRAAGMLLDDHAPAEVLTSLLGDFLGRYEIDPLGRLSVRVAGPASAAMHPAKILPHRGARAWAETSRDAIINQAPMLYARDYRGGRHIRHDDGGARRSASSQRLYGVRTPPESPLALDWVRRGHVARTLQSRIVERARLPARMITIQDATLRALEVEPDDFVAFSAPWMRSESLEPLINQIGEVVAVSCDLAEQTTELKIRDTGFFLTRARPLDGSETLGGGWPLGAGRDTTSYA